MIFILFVIYRLFARRCNIEIAHYKKIMFIPGFIILFVAASRNIVSDFHNSTEHTHIIYREKKTYYQFLIVVFTNAYINYCIIYSLLVYVVAHLKNLCFFFLYWSMAIHLELFELFICRHAVVSRIIFIVKPTFLFLEIWIYDKRIIICLYIVIK